MRTPGRTFGDSQGIAPLEFWGGAPDTSVLGADEQHEMLQGGTPTRKSIVAKVRSLLNVQPALPYPSMPLVQLAAQLPDPLKTYLKHWA